MFLLDVSGHFSRRAYEKKTIFPDKNGLSYVI